MRVLARWTEKCRYVTHFDSQPLRDVALGQSEQHLLLALWAYAGGWFCFKATNGKLRIDLAKGAPRRRRRRASRRR